jgi:hypothetical protein
MGTSAFTDLNPPLHHTESLSGDPVQRNSTGGAHTGDSPSREIEEDFEDNIDV